MNRFTHLLTIVLVVTLADFEFALAYEPAIQWQKTFGGSEYDEGHSVQQTSDGGYIIAGSNESFGAGQADVYLIKTDSSGNSQWQKTFGGSNYDWGYSVQQTSDGGYIIAGWTSSFGAGGEDVYLIKTNSAGNSQWQKTFGGSGDDFGRSVKQTKDGGYIITGGTESFGAGLRDVYLIKTDSSGNSQWQKTFGGGSYDWGDSVQQTKDGGYIIVGSIWSPSGWGYDVYLIKTDSSGNQEWQKTHVLSGYFDDNGHSVQQTIDGGYIIAGDTGGYDVYLIKTDSDGNLSWQKTFGGIYYDQGYSVQQTSDGGYIIAGYIDGGYWPGSENGNVYLIKTDSDGNLSWQKTLGGSGREHGQSVQQTSDGGYIIAGWTSSFGAGEYDVYLIKLSSEFCQYVLFGDLNDDCKVEFYDFAIMAMDWLVDDFSDLAEIADDWLIDCNIDPTNPACVPK